MIEHTTAISRQLYTKLQQHYPTWGVADLTYAGGGLESLIYRANTRAFGAIAVRIPRTRWTPGEDWAADDSDVVFDWRDFLRQEVELANHLGTFGVAIPPAYALHFDDDFDFMISAFIENDQSQFDPYQFGQIMHTLHSSPAPTTSLVWNRGVPLNDVLAARMSQRAPIIERIGKVRVRIPPRDEIRMMLEWQDARQCCLHMDAWTKNILTYRGEIRALIDWSSAILGDPTLELARLAEYGFLSSSFLEGYGDRGALTRLPRTVELLYRLDTAIMLAFVFLSLAPDRQNAPRYVRRVVELSKMLESDSEISV